MSYPAPPGFNRPSSTHPSLPSKPPIPSSGSHPLFKPTYSSASTSTNGAPGTSQGSSAPAFTAFTPRSVASSTPHWQNHSPTVSAGPTPPSSHNQQSNYGRPGAYSQGASAYPQKAYYDQGYEGGNYDQRYGEQYAQAKPPQIRNPFVPPSQNEYGRGSDQWGNKTYDPDTEAQIAQWQSAYASKDEYAGKGTGAYGANSVSNATNTAAGTRGNTQTLTNQEVASAAKPDSGVAAVVSGADGKQSTVVRSGGGKSWQDSSLLDWDPAHFRLFVGNLAGEVTDDSLMKAFSRYASVQKTRVVRDKRTSKSKGFGFVSFSDGDDYFKAAKEMQNKYIGSHPVLLRKSTTDIKPVIPQDKKKGSGGKGKGVGGHANTNAGVQKKQGKMKNGLKILG